MVTPFLVLIVSLVGTLWVSKYLPTGQAPHFILLAGTIVSFLLAGILYLFSTSSELKNLLKDLRVAKIKLEEEKAKDEAILRGIGEGMIAVDKDRRILFMSHSAEEMIGWKTRDAIGRHTSEIIGMEYEEGRSVPVERRPIHLAFRTGEKVTNDAYYFVPKGKPRFPAAVTVTPIMRGIETLGVILLFRDITKEREIDRAKTEFVSLASHQLRTPLSTVKWYAEILLSGDLGKLTPEQRKYAEEIYESNERMIKLVNALLSVSRIDLGTFAIEPEPTDIRRIPELALKDLVSQIKEKKLTVVKKYDKNIPLFNLDPKLTLILFQNFFSNAIKYTPAGGKITLEITRHPSSILIKVSDTGYGIPKNQQSKIFTKLFRADNIREVEPAGTGLGLYIVKAIVERSGGRIWFESEENKGTTFYVAIPLAGMKRQAGAKGLT